MGGINMNYVIWIAPLIMIIGTTLYFNIKSGTYYSNKLVAGFSLLDVIVTYSFSMIFLSRMVTTQIAYSFMFVVIITIALITQLTLFEKMVGGKVDAISTLKENVLLLFTTFIPFLLFLFVFKELDIYFIAIVLSLVCAAGIFGISVLIRKHVPGFLDDIGTELDLSHGTKVITFWVVIGIIIFSSYTFFSNTIILEENLYLDTDSSFNVAQHDRDNVFDWENITVIEAKSAIATDGYTTSISMIIRDVDNMEYLVILDRETNDYNESFVYFPLVENTEDSGASQTRINGDASHFIPTNKGLYLYNDTDISVVSITQDKKVDHFYNNGDFYVVHQGSNEFDIITRNGTLVDNFTASGIEVINDTLFIVESNRYILYTNGDLTYTKLENTVPFYNSITDSFYQIEYSKRKATIHIDNKGTLNSVSIFTQEGDSIIPILEGVEYNSRQFSFRNKVTRLDNGIYIYAMQNSLDSYDSFLKYDESHQVEYLGSSEVHVLDSLNKDGDTTFTTANFVFNSDEYTLLTNTSRAFGRYGFVVLVFMVLPVVTYNSPIAVISFNETAYRKATKKKSQ